MQNNDLKSIVPSTDEIRHGTYLSGIIVGNEGNSRHHHDITMNVGSEYPNREWGYGRINIFSTFETLRGTS